MTSRKNYATMASVFSGGIEMKGLFRLDGPLMTVMTHITDCIFLSLFFVLGCIPIVTIGTSFAALYDATFRGIRENEKNSWQRFLHTYRQNWKLGIIPTLVFSALLIALGYGMIQIWNNAVYENISWAIFAGLALLSVGAMGVLSLLFPMLSRFDNPTTILFKNSFALGLAHLPRTLVLGLINVGTAFLCIRLVFPVFFLPATAALVGSYLIEPIFRPYMPEETEDTEEAAD